MSDNGVGDVQIPLAFSINEWSLIRAGLYELPAKVAIATIGKLERQLAELSKPKVKEAEIP